MTSELDIYRSARSLIKQHGNEAAIFAAMNADTCLERNDHERKATCLRVIEAIKVLSDKSGASREETLH